MNKQSAKNPLEIDGSIVFKNFRVKGVTAFKLLDLFSQGQDILYYLKYFKRSNLLRTFSYTPKEIWGLQFWNEPTFNSFVSFCDYVAQYGFYVEHVLITDDDDSRINYVKDFIQKLNLVDIPNLALLQGVNEPEVNMNTSRIKNILTSTKYLYTSGDQEDLTKWYGKVGTYQIPRDSESVRKEEALHECYDGGGPNNSNEKGYKTVWFDDEVVRPDQLLDYNKNNIDLTIKDYYTIGALASLAGGGCNFHYNGGKFNILPNNFEALCYNAMMDGLEVFPLDTAKNGSWEHLRNLENPDSPNPLALRIYKRGKYVVVVRPNNFVPPSNWKSLDDKNICYELE